MKQLFTLLLAAIAFVACTQNDVDELSANRVDVPETLTVGFEGGDTRIELNEALKTVWTEGDEVSVFYYSDANNKFAYQGETGERFGELKLVGRGDSVADVPGVVTVYPYNPDYKINALTANLLLNLPSKQYYKSDSYGENGNIMVAYSEFNQFMLRSIYGWLKLQLTGNGELVSNIKFRGNNGEQVAGLVYVDADTAELTLSTAMGSIPEEDGEAAGGTGGNLVFEDSILTETTLNCGTGVKLGEEPTSFYIALPPHTFEKGITVEVEAFGYRAMEITTANVIEIKRNYIQPMSAVAFDGELIEIYELAYTTNNGEPIDPYTTTGFGANFIDNIYDAESGSGVLQFDGQVTVIPANAFTACENLTWIDLPYGIKSIGSTAFNGCLSLAEITIPASATTIGSNAFKGCRSKATINCNDVSFAGTEFTEVVIGENVKTIASSAFKGCKYLTKVTIPDGVVKIGGNAFSGCSSLLRVDIPDSVTNLVNGNNFLDCTSLKSATIGDNVKIIGGNAFMGCASLESVVIGKSVTEVYGGAFSGCSSLKAVTIPEGVTEIGGSAFYNCSSLAEVVLPNNLLKMGTGSFFGCSALRSISLPDGLTEIGINAFKESGLESLTIPDSVTTIGNSLLESCSNLRSVVFGDGITLIPNKTCQNCIALESLVIGSNVGTIEWSAFWHCSTIKEIVIPDKVTVIDSSVFRGCSALTSVTIGKRVTSIGGCAFADCKNLTEITLPSGLTHLSFYAFENCTNLETVICKPITPPSISKTDGKYWCAFDGNHEDRKIYVPAESLESYKTTAYWSDYADDYEVF